MIIYNPKDWIKLVFSFNRNDTFRVLLPGMFGMALFTLVVDYFIIDFLRLSYKGSSVVHSLLGFVISLLLVFRTNTAYERWWEGRKIWGNMLNNSRNMALQLKSFLSNDTETLEDFWVLISNYSLACKEHLRNNVQTTQFQNNIRYPNTIWNSTIQHIPNHIALMMMEKIDLIRKEGRCNDFQYYKLIRDVEEFINYIGACERIKNTPIPYAYSLFIKKFIVIYVITMPFAFVSDFGYWAIPIVVFVFYVLSSLELIAEEIEDPFGNDINDLSTDEICKAISKNTREIMGLI